jgi:SpoVK/Ycf46/Vps4 family AAA+-type ATPase
VQLTFYCCIFRLRLEGNFDLFNIARSTPGFVGADLKSLVDKAGNLAMKRIIDKRKSMSNLEDWWRRPWEKLRWRASASLTACEVEFFSPLHDNNFCSKSPKKMPELNQLYFIAESMLIASAIYK